MQVKTISMSNLEKNLQATLYECADTGNPIVVEMPDQRRLTLQILEDDDDDQTDRLIETNAAFRELLAKAATSPRKKFNVDCDSTTE